MSAVPAVIPGLDPATYRRHALHDGARRWPETNCYVDLWIEVLAAHGYEPEAVLGFTLAQDYEGDQFTFFKMPTEDLTRFYGLEVLELAIFDRVERHILEQIARGRLVLVEVDAHFLPDTRGVTYRSGHSKTTIAVNALDPAERRMAYFHNAGFFALEGDDYDGIFGAAGTAVHGGLPLFPYVEFVKFDVALRPRDLVGVARQNLAHHLARRPRENPLRAWEADFERHVADLAARPPEWFHTYAFNTVRQIGANFELLASHLVWLGAHGEAGLDDARAAADRIAEDAKTLQFKLARATARRRFDGLTPLIGAMALSYDALMRDLAARYEGDSAAAGRESPAAKAA